MKRRHALLAGGSCLAGLLSGCSAFEGASDGSADTTTSAGRSTPESTVATTPGTPTTTLTQGGTETPTATTTRFTADDGESRYFGGSLDTSGDVAVVGAQGTGSDVDGMAYVFAWSDGSWSRRATLVPDGDSSYAPHPVAVSGDTVLVGNDVYTPTGESWTQQATLVPDGVDRLDVSEIAIAIDDDTAVVATPDDGEAGAYVFHCPNGSWEHRVTLEDPGGEWGTGFGSAVSIDGETLVVGSPAGGASSGGDAGSAHVFARRRGTWTEQTTLTPAGTGDARFGASVSLSGDSVVVGAGRDDDPEDEHSGSAYVFERTDGDWRRQAHLVPSGENQDGWLGQYGDAVALAGDTALLSGAWSPTPQRQDGVESVFLFSRDGGSWSQSRILKPANEDAGGVLGPVRIAGETALVGAPLGGPDQAGDHGVVYVYRLR